MTLLLAAFALSGGIKGLLIGFLLLVLAILLLAGLLYLVETYIHPIPAPVKLGLAIVILVIIVFWFLGVTGVS